MKLNFIKTIVLILCICLNAGFAHANSEHLNITNMQINKVKPEADKQHVKHIEDKPLVGEKIEHVEHAKTLQHHANDHSKISNENTKVEKHVVSKHKPAANHKTHKKKYIVVSFSGANVKLISSISPKQPALKVEPEIVEVDEHSNKIINHHQEKQNLHHDDSNHITVKTEEKHSIEEHTQSQVNLTEPPAEKIKSHEEVEETHINNIEHKPLLLKDIKEGKIEEPSYIPVIFKLLFVIGLIYITAYGVRYLKTINPKLFNKFVEKYKKQTDVKDPNDPIYINELGSLKPECDIPEEQTALKDYKYNKDEEIIYSQTEDQYEAIQSDIYKEYLD